MASTGTAPDPNANEWAICDEVVQLREWGTTNIYPLPQPPASTGVIGADQACTVALTDPAGLMSRQHARLTRREKRWIVRDLESKNGLRIDGFRRDEFVLDPGLEIGLGGVTLIAESARLIALRGFLARLLGWAAERAGTVDRALRSIRMAVAHRTALVLSGAGDLVMIARSLHRRARGDDRPFIMCDPRRRRSSGNVRSTANFEAAVPALKTATGGSLCVWSQRLPPDFADALALLRKPKTRVQLIVCTQEQKPLETTFELPISVPSLAERSAELDRIILEYAADAIAELGASASFSAADHAWVRAYSSASLPEIEKATRRLVAIRAYQTLTRAAEHLGMTPVSLQRWMGRRQLPAHVKHRSRTGWLKRSR